MTKVSDFSDPANPFNRVVTVSSTYPPASEGWIYGVCVSDCPSVGDFVNVQLTGVVECNVYAIKATVPPRTWDAGSVVYAAPSSADGSAQLPDGLIFAGSGSAAVGILLESFTLSGGAGSSAVIKRKILLSGYTLGTAAG